MTNLKKIGLTALAGTLASTSYAIAGDLSVTGTARMEYQSTADSATANTDSFADNSTLTFSGSGELDNGFGVSIMKAIAPQSNNEDVGTFEVTSEHVSLDMGDMGTISMANGMNPAGIGSIQDMVPNAGEQPWDDLGTTHGGPEDGLASPHSGHRLGYSVNAAGATISAAADYQNNTPTTSVAIKLDGLVEGLNIGGGLATDAQAATEDDIETVYASFAYGPITVGVQNTKVEKDAADTDIERDSYGITFAVNENLSVGYGVSDVEYDALANDEESTGIQASYTSGGMKIGFVNNKKDNLNGGTTNMEMNELMLTFSF
jgi:outer membrane protein OmpU